MIAMMVPLAFHSDGCTFPCPLAGRMMGQERYRLFCKEHDFLRHYAIIHWLRADLLLFKRIWHHSPLGKVRAPLYLFFVVASHPFYKHTAPVPYKWRDYAAHYAWDKWTRGGTE